MILPGSIRTIEAFATHENAVLIEKGNYGHFQVVHNNYDRSHTLLCTRCEEIATGVQV